MTTTIRIAKKTHRNLVLYQMARYKKTGLKDSMGAIIEGLLAAKKAAK
jgi:hypothetical protein